MKILGVVLAVDQLMAGGKFRQLADHRGQDDVLGASRRGMADGLPEKVPDLHKGNVGEGEKPLLKMFPAPPHRKHQLLAALGDGHVDILEHTGFPGSRGVWHHNARRPQNGNTVKNPQAWIESFARQFCTMRDGDLHRHAAWHELGLRQDLVYGLGEHLARHRINRWLSWRYWHAFFGD